MIRDLSNQTAHRDRVILLLRVSLGSLSLAHGFLKLLMFTLPGTTEFFT